MDKVTKCIPLCHLCVSLQVVTTRYLAIGCVQYVHRSFFYQFCAADTHTVIIFETQQNVTLDLLSTCMICSCTNPLNKLLQAKILVLFIFFESHKAVTVASLFYYITHYSPLYTYLHCSSLVHRFNPKTGLLGMSHAQFPSDQLGPGGGLFLSLVGKLGLAKVERGVGDSGKEIRVNNLTIINFVLKLIGPTHERTLTVYMMIIQVSRVCTAIV